MVRWTPSQPLSRTAAGRRRRGRRSRTAGRWSAPSPSPRACRGTTARRRLPCGTRGRATRAAIAVCGEGWQTAGLLPVRIEERTMSIVLAVLLVPTIWIVDAANGPGTNFTSLPAAVAAAASGDTLIVRRGTYQPFQVSGKALTIRGEAAGLV